ncbi:MAG: hypothetical protein II563_09545 [Treponema sp.]|nr:hypothetical protein [Treponema sp.]MBQ2553072.1 hypothetical protein [Treponema sp.]MBQ4236929.1 hypothetical protein [Treponema sp.]MBQ5384486.1 hypothetical protein [Treponema sp.]
MEELDSPAAGRKTFFIAPDITILPESYMEEYMTRGYEAYIIVDDRYCPIGRKIELIISMYPNSIFFFYIDAKIEGIEWPKFIYKMQREHGNEALFGILYLNAKTEAEKERIKKFYLFDVGVQCGCIGLDYQHKKNFVLIDSVLKANQATGKRKTIRATCTGASEVSFVRDNLQYRGKINDISLSHFSCQFYEGTLPQYSKVKDMMLVIDGIHIQTNGVLLMQRPIPDGGKLNVFVFAKNDGTFGLEGENFIRVSEKIYQLISTKTKEMLHRLFVTAGKELEESQAAEKLKQQAIQSAKNKAEKLAKAEQESADGK